MARKVYTIEEAAALGIVGRVFYCEECETPLVGPQHARYCSDACRARASYHRRRQGSRRRHDSAS